MSGEEQVILVTTALMPTVIAVMNLTTLPRNVPTRFLHQECHTTIADLIQGIDASTTGGTDHTPIMAPDIGDISAGHSPTHIPTMTEAAVLEGTPYALLAIAAAHAAPQLMNVPITPHAVISTGIAILHPALFTSPVGATHATLWIRASLTSATSSTQHKDVSPEKSCNAQDPQPP